MKLSLTLIFVVFSFMAFSCTCSGPRDFCSVLSDSRYSSDNILMGKKLRGVEHGMLVQIIETYRDSFRFEEKVIWIVKS